MATMSDDLADELGTQETPSLEFKQDPRNRNALREAICALANDLPGADVGDLVIGVRKDGSPVGADVHDDALLSLANLRDEGRILDRPTMLVKAATYQGTPVVRVRVWAAAAPPVRFDGVVWVRPGPTTRRASRDEERLLTERRRVADLPFDRHAVAGSTADDLDAELFRSTYLPAAVDQSVIEENQRPLDHQMASLGLLDLRGSPTVLGLLLVGYDPSEAISGSYVQFVRYDGSDLDAAVADEQEIRHNVIGTAPALATVLTGHLHTRLVEVGDFREEHRPNYPIDALRELCMNALMHRNYESSNAPTRILWFDDRIEVSNPGGPFGQVRADNFDRVNDYRNPSLAAAMKSLGYVNRFGRGIGRIRAALGRNGNPPPDFDIDPAYWTVVVRRAP